jgi:TetR/AcrR family transcriptional regulator, transcriptional repressor for nem operon
MARPKEFDQAAALDAAINVFREHGFEGSSAGMLVGAMGIGRQSLYDTFGDKWQLYLEAVRRYAERESAAHLQALKDAPSAPAALEAVVMRVVHAAGEACLGVSSVCEFGRSQPELALIHDAAARLIRTGIAARVEQAQAEGSVRREQDAGAAADFLMASFATIRLAARGGAGPEQLHQLGQYALRALR